jgi:hypothetical protein
MTRFIGCIMALMLFNVAELQAQGYLDGLMDRATQSATRKAQDRVNQNIEQSIDKAIKKTEETVKCVATDQECLKRAKEEGKPVQTVNTRMHEAGEGTTQEGRDCGRTPTRHAALFNDRYRLPHTRKGDGEEG